MTENLNRLLSILKDDRIYVIVLIVFAMISTGVVQSVFMTASGSNICEGKDSKQCQELKEK